MILAFLVTTLLLTATGCCYYEESTLLKLEPPVIVAEINQRKMMDLLGIHFRGITPRGTTIGRYLVTTLEEYQRGIKELLYPGIDPYVALGRLREWCPHLAVGLTWDIAYQTHRLVVLTGMPFQFYFFSFESLQRIPRPKKLLYVIM